MRKILLIGLLGLITGCAQMTHYQPVVDLQNDPNAGRYNYDMQACQQLAEQNAGAGKGAASDGLVGALVGAGGGAALGAIIGNPATGAAIGGTIGGLGGATKGGIEGDARYKNIFKSCMRQRGHTVLD